jgi:hypothetical protein
MAVHFRLDALTFDWKEVAGQILPPLTSDQILCWQVTGVKPTIDPKDNVIWNSTYDEYITCQECLELKHA